MKVDEKFRKFEKSDASNCNYQFCKQTRFDESFRINKDNQDKERFQVFDVEIQILWIQDVT